MTIDEAVHRLVRGHWLLILICVVLPGLAVFHISSTQQAMYEAVGRLQVGSTLASSNVEADAASTRAMGIVTSPGFVQRALADAHLAVDPTQFALDHIDVRRVGVSTVIEVAVSNQSPKKAALIAKSLTDQLLKFANSGDRQSEIGQISSLDSSIASLTKQRNALIPNLAIAFPGEQLALQTQISGLQATLSNNLQERSNLIVAMASRPSTVLLDPVRIPTIPLPQKPLQLAALAALLGLILGLGLAAVLETLRPTLRNPKAISYAVNAPVIGHLDLRDLEALPGAPGMSGIADRMALLGLRHGSSLAMLLSVRVDDQPLAGELAEALASNGDARTRHRLWCAALNGHWIDPGEHPAIVIFSPAKIRARELRPVQELIDSIDWPVLGVVTYDRRRFFSRRGVTHPATDPVAQPITHTVTQPGKRSVTHPPKRVMAHPTNDVATDRRTV